MDRHSSSQHAGASEKSTQGPRTSDQGVQTGSFVETLPTGGRPHKRSDGRELDDRTGQDGFEHGRPSLDCPESQSFLLMRLPKELRQMIYREAIPDKLRVIDVQFNLKSFGTRSLSIDVRVDPGESVNLLRTSKHVRAEACGLLPYVRARFSHMNALRTLVETGTDRIRTLLQQCCEIYIGGMDPAFQWRPTIATLSRLEHLVNVTFSWCWGVELDAEWPAFLQALDRFYNHLRRNGQRERKEVKLVVRLMECPVGHRKYPTLLQDECHEQWDNADGAERGWKLRFSDWQASNIYCNANREEDLALRKKLSVYQNMQCITPSAR